MEQGVELPLGVAGAAYGVNLDWGPTQLCTWLRDNDLQNDFIEQNGLGAWYTVGLATVPGAEGMQVS